MNLHIIESSVDDQTIKNSNTAIVIGISISNSYFKEENIKNLILWALSLSSKVYVMIPDEPMVHTYMAMGYTYEASARKSRLKANALKNKCRDIFQSLFCEAQLIFWDNLKDNDFYQNSLLQIVTSYQKDLIFKGEINKMTQNVLYNHHIPYTEDAVQKGAQFILKELAFICRSDLILGHQNTLYVYHKTMELLREILKGNYPFKASPGIGFLTVQ